MNRTNHFGVDMCPIHGPPRKRSVCLSCNAAYMRSYQRIRRATRPELELLNRARKRARLQDVIYSLKRGDIAVPETCPVLGIPLVNRGSRTDTSISLDRIRPEGGYVIGNVRVLSDRANRLKSDRTIEQIQHLAATGPSRLREDYSKIAIYMEREALLAEVRTRAAAGGRCGQEWLKIANFLERVFSGR